jgi:hypothetical protein
MWAHDADYFFAASFGTADAGCPLSRIWSGSW